MDEDLLREIRAMNKTLANIERLLRKMPEVQSAVFLQMQEVADSGHLHGEYVKDLWEVCPPEQR